MKRLIDNDLLKWKNDRNHKPLLILGARQIGKTYSMTKLGKDHYDNFVYLNFEQEGDELKSIFKKDLRPERIIRDLQLYRAVTIRKNKTLIIFDEIQTCEEALTSLKYFNEQAPEYDIVAAGSLFGVALNRKNYSFPVGKVDMITMYPFNFEEFLLAISEENLIDVIKESYLDGSPMVHHQKALELYRTYLVTGGYPDVILAYMSNSDFISVRNKQNIISNSYIADMTRYSTPNETIRTIEIYNSIFSQFSKITTRFQYSVVNPKARSRTYEDSLNWLLKSNVVYKCNLITEGKYPVTAYEDRTTFKIYQGDIGIFTLNGNLQAEKIIANIGISDKVNGIMAENYVAATLKYNNLDLYYWEKNTSEVDFITHINGEVIPIEVKSSDNVRSKSLKIYIEKYKPKYSIRISSKNFGFENNIYSIPLYAAFCIGKYPSIADKVKENID